MIGVCVRAHACVRICGACVHAAYMRVCVRHILYITFHFHLNRFTRTNSAAECWRRRLKSKACSGNWQVESDATNGPALSSRPVRTSCRARLRQTSAPLGDTQSTGHCVCNANPHPQGHTLFVLCCSAFIMYVWTLCRE